MYQTLQDKTGVFGKIGRSFFLLSSQLRKVVLGKRPVSSDPIGYCDFHQALKITAMDVDPIEGEGLWTEVMGKFENQGYLVLDSGSPALPVGISEMGVESQGETPPVRELGLTGRRDCEIHLFKREWVEDHPEFGLLGANCRRYVSDLADFLRVVV